ncbi:decarboxylase [Streptomyces sp. NPDC058733]|uniref:decarboxylase n=1 Tax=Streptomyces sp. NPDC058733 TaxID=3346614 RepID=UPI00368A4E4B
MDDRSGVGDLASDMRGRTTLAPEPTVVNRAAPTMRCPAVSHREVVPLAEATFLGGPDSAVISADQVTMWAAPRRLGTRAVGPYQARTDLSARAWPPVLPDEPQEQQEGRT